MLTKYIHAVAWAWMIIVGGLLIFLPHGPVICIACGGIGSILIGVISAVLGVAGFVLRGSNPMPGR